MRAAHRVRNCKRGAPPAFASVTLLAGLHTLKSKFLKRAPFNVGVRVCPASIGITLAASMQLQEITDGDHPLSLEDKARLIGGLNPVYIKASRIACRPPTAIQQGLQMGEADLIR